MALYHVNISQMASIKTLFVSTSFPRTTADWRGIFIANISAALARHPEIELTQWAPPGEVHQQVRIATTEQEAAWLNQLMEIGGISHWLRTRPASGLLAAVKLLQMLALVYRRYSNEIDIYHINWLQCALPLPHDKKPALITVLGNDMRLLHLPVMKKALRRVMKNRTVIICPNANWMEKPLQAAFGDIAAIRSVPFGIEPRWYAIHRTSNNLCRPSCWLAVTRLTANKLGPLFEWCAPLFRDKQRVLHLFGPMQEQIELPDWVHYHGPASPDQLATDWFPKAQGLITLSQHAEGRPQVMLEAMAAGLPIIASRIPAHEDIVFHGETGWLCDTPEDVTQGLKYFDTTEENLRSGQAARTWSAREIGTWDDCAARYVNLYKTLNTAPCKND